MSYTVSSSPHITEKNNSTRRIMLDVLIALVPCVIAATVFFGYHVLINLFVCAITCMGTEILTGCIIKKSFSRDSIYSSTAFDFSCFVTATILALNLPATMNVWGLNIVVGAATVFSFDTVIVCFIGSIFAIAICKMLFGGIGRNFANPACTARIFLLLTFASSFVASQTLGSFGFVASTGATWLGSQYKLTDGTTLFNLFIGNVGSSAVGETCVIAVAIGYVYLSLRKIIDWRVPLMIVAWSAVFAFLFDATIVQQLPLDKGLLNALANVMSGGLLFGSVFMATDYATSPNTFLGNCIYCFGIALLTMLIRVFAAYPEGMSFAILIMNCIVPLIDKYVYPKPFGYIGNKNKERGL